MDHKRIEILERALQREKSARKQAEKILETKSRELYFLSEKLQKTNTKLEHLLDEKSSQLQGVFENIIDAYIVIDLKGDVIRYNNAAADLFEFSDKNKTYNSLSLIYEEDKPYAQKCFFELMVNSFFKNFETRVVSKDNEVKWVQMNGSLIYDSQKKPIAAQGILRDISNQRAKDEELLESKNRMSSLIANLDTGILLEDENRKIILANPKFCELFKIPVSQDELIGQDCTNAAEESKGYFENPTAFVERIREILQHKKQVLGDELTLLDGTVLERDFIPILIGSVYKGHLWSYRDITLNKQYNQSLENQKQKYSSIIANMNLGLVEVDNDDNILMINQSFSEMSGYSEEDLIGKKGNEVLVQDKESTTIQNESLKRLQGNSNSYELKVKNKDGTIRNWLISGAPNYNLQGEIVGSIGIHLDITEQKELQIQKEIILKELEKRNEELQEYAHIVSHDLKSPLRSIEALVSWIKTDNLKKLDTTTLQNFELIESTLETMEKLISNILEYSSVGFKTESTGVVDVNKLIENIKKTLLIPDTTSFIIPEKLPFIKGDYIKFQQLFQNLISNALKFSDKKQTIIEIGCTENKNFYEFFIKDNGVGIEPKYHDKIFKIFQSLQKRDDSTGIGLSIVKKIVDIYGGTIWIDSIPKVGSTFYFTLKK